MKKFLLIIFLFFLVSCTSNYAKKEFNFTDEMSFNQFKLMLNEYAVSIPPPQGFLSLINILSPLGVS